jgi:hypothetical protein
MTDLPECICAICIWFKSTAEKAGWHSKKECSQNKETNMEFLKLEGWWCPERKQQAMKKLYGMLLHSKGKFDDFTSQNEITCQEIVNEVFR